MRLRLKAVIQKLLWRNLIFASNLGVFGEGFGNLEIGGTRWTVVKNLRVLNFVRGVRTCVRLSF